MDAVRCARYSFHAISGMVHRLVGVTDLEIRLAYGALASEYTAMLGSIEDMNDLDRDFISTWAKEVNGNILDVGCGPGHWTDFLRLQGADVTGIDLVPEFIHSARQRFPETAFKVSNLRALEQEDGSLQGLLAWYSMIHLPPTELPSVFTEFARVLSPGGRLLIGFFEGAAATPFDHAVTTAYYWSAHTMSCLLEEAGFRIVAIDTRDVPMTRPHSAISAVLR